MARTTTKTAEQTAPAEAGAAQAEQDHDYYLLTEAPIAEMAEAFNMDIDSAVKMRVEEAVRAATDVQVNVRAIEPRGKLIGLAEVQVAGLKVDDFKVFNGDKGLFLGPPSVKDPSARGGFRRTARASEGLQEVLDAKALDGYNAAVEKLVARAAAAQAMTVKPKPIREQMEQAGQEAAKANADRQAARPAPARGGNDR